MRENELKSIHSLYKFQDSIYEDKNSMVLNVRWMDSLIQIQKTIRVMYDLNYERKFRKDSTYIPKPTDTLRMNEMRKNFSQNCYSYALEKYFMNAGLKDELLFTAWTRFGGVQMNTILFTAFEKINSFETKRKKCKDCSFNNGSLLVFRDKWNRPMHAVYYDGKFHSKYGGWAAKAEEDVDTILKAYWDTVRVEEYRLDDKKIQDYLVHRREIN
jgi:hypothetical protein